MPSSLHTHRNIESPAQSTFRLRHWYTRTSADQPPPGREVQCSFSALGALTVGAVTSGNLPSISSSALGVDAEPML